MEPTPSRTQTPNCYQEKTAKPHTQNAFPRRRCACSAGGSFSAASCCGLRMLACIGEDGKIGGGSLSRLRVLGPVGIQASAFLWRLLWPTLWPFPFGRGLRLSGRHNSPACSNNIAEDSHAIWGMRATHTTNTAQSKQRKPEYHQMSHSQNSSHMYSQPSSLLRRVLYDPYTILSWGVLEPTTGPVGRRPAQGSLV